MMWASWNIKIVSELLSQIRGIISLLLSILDDGKLFGILLALGDFKIG
jgi:hypothetical protein